MFSLFSVILHCKPFLHFLAMTVLASVCWNVSVGSENGVSENENAVFPHKAVEFVRVDKFRCTWHGRIVTKSHAQEHTDTDAYTHITSITPYHHQSRTYCTEPGIFYNAWLSQILRLVHQIQSTHDYTVFFFSSYKTIGVTNVHLR